MMGWRVCEKGKSCFQQCELIKWLAWRRERERKWRRGRKGEFYRGIADDEEDG